MFHDPPDPAKIILLISEEESINMDIQELHEISGLYKFRVISFEEFPRIILSHSEIVLIMIYVLAALGNDKSILDIIRKEKPTVPLILLSRHLSPETVRLAAIYHFQEVIQLPVKPETIQTLINKYVKK